jgi:hypothetical protein
MNLGFCGRQLMIELSEEWMKVRTVVCLKKDQEMTTIDIEKKDPSIRSLDASIMEVWISGIEGDSQVTA